MNEYKFTSFSPIDLLALKKNPHISYFYWSSLRRATLKYIQCVDLTLDYL